ncbi:hypothetical protein [Opitutus sp. GAS368]|jgi:hypothetical protein|uniref:hypothetical protein n=1 Tax=Opitutus sp. GAS368 TaxID=1882749 RepID=UPI001560E108|nr:hypothetical protein [Opitutus sp. GAS368]
MSDSADRFFSHEKARKVPSVASSMFRAPLGALPVALAVDFLRLFVAKPALVDRG